MDKPINERFIKLSSRLPFDRDLKLGDDLQLQFHSPDGSTIMFIANCVKIEYEDQQDGTQNVIYKLKFTAE